MADKKKVTDELKSFFCQETSACAVKKDIRKKIEQLEELIDEQINQNPRNTLTIPGVTFNILNEKS